MKNLKRIAELTKSIVQKDRSTWVNLYYSIEKHTVYDRPGDGRLYVCDLINVNTPKDVQEAVEDWLKM